jgi:hypothetical protein
MLTKRELFNLRGVYSDIPKLAKKGEWETFERFRQWAEERGYEENMRLARIDQDLPVSAENCVIADFKYTARKRETCHYIEIDGENHCIAEWTEKLSFRRNTIYHWIAKFGEQYAAERIENIIKERRTR